MSISTEVGRNIVFLRKAGNITQEWLAFETDISVTYLRAIEHGRANPTIEMLSRIAYALDVPFEILFAVDLEKHYEQLMQEYDYECPPLSPREIAVLHATLSTLRKTNAEGLLNAVYDSEGYRH